MYIFENIENKVTQNHFIKYFNIIFFKIYLNICKTFSQNQIKEIFTINQYKKMRTEILLVKNLYYNKKILFYIIIYNDFFFGIEDKYI